jgi:hypothetical protein
MNTFKRLKDTFRARDEQGTEYEVKVYAEVSTGHTTGGAFEAEGFASAEGTPLSGPLAGQTFPVQWVEGDTYQIWSAGPGPKITRIRP